MDARPGTGAVINVFSTYKSYKREVAFFALAVMYAFIGYTLHTLAILHQTSAMVDLVGTLVIPTFVTVAAAFGIDAYYRQNPKEVAITEENTKKE